MHFRDKIRCFVKSRRGGIFDEAMLLGAKGLILILILAALSISIISILDRFSSYLQSLASELPS